jgi:hypothetical protein
LAACRAASGFGALGWLSSSISHDGSSSGGSEHGADRSDSSGNHDLNNSSSLTSGTTGDSARSACNTNAGIESSGEWCGLSVLYTDAAEAPVSPRTVFALAALSAEAGVEALDGALGRLLYVRPRNVGARREGVVAAATPLAAVAVDPLAAPPVAAGEQEGAPHAPADPWRGPEHGAVTMPDKALVSIMTRQGEMVGFFVHVSSPPAAAEQLHGARGSGSPGTVQPVGSARAVEAPHRPSPGGLKLCFVQVKHVRSARPIDGELSARLYMDLNAERARLHARQTRQLVSVVPLDSSPLPDGRPLVACDLCCEPGFACAAILNSIAAERKRTGGMTPAGANVVGKRSADAARAAPQVRGKVETFCQIGEQELRRAQLWCSRPAVWKLRLAWSAHLLMLIGLGLAILLVALTSPSFGDGTGAWLEVVIASAETQALKLLVAEPLTFILASLAPWLVARCVRP